MRKTNVLFCGIVAIGMFYTPFSSTAAAAEKSKATTGTPAATVQPASVPKASPNDGSGGGDDVAQRQSMDAFTSIEDAQPGEPGQVELQIDLGGYGYPHGRGGSAIFDPLLKYTGQGNHFLENMKLEVSTDLVVGDGEVKGNGDVTLGWQQRWVSEHGNVPTLGTLIEIRLPTGYHSSGVDVSLTGILDKDIGPGTAYLSASIMDANGDNDENLRHTQWGFQAGYKWRLSDTFALIGDYVHKSSESHDEDSQNLLEFAGEYHVNDHLIIGPGVVFGLGNSEEEPNFGAGVRATFSF